MLLCMEEDMITIER